jgi:hypothetical protein
VRLTRLLRGAPAASQQRPRRRVARPGAPPPRTIVPLPDAPETATDPFAVSVDAARERLRRAIPPVADDAAE